VAIPQVEDGHTQIANEILQHLMTVRLPGNHWQVLMCILRQTCGYHKEADYIPNCRIAADTGLCPAVVSRALRSLQGMHIITRKGRFIGLQKDWEQWKMLAIPSTKLAESLTNVSNTANNQKLAKLLTSGTKLAESSTIEKLAIPSTNLAESSIKVSRTANTLNIKENTLSLSTKEILKKKYGDFQNVLFTDLEYEKLLAQFNGQLANKIKSLSLYIASTGKKYQSHYATILAWERRDEARNTRPAIATNAPVMPRSLPTTDELKKSWGNGGTDG
jgi:phage replication O-like protein O